MLSICPSVYLAILTLSTLMCTQQIKSKTLFLIIKFVAQFITKAYLYLGKGSITDLIKPHRADVEESQICVCYYHIPKKYTLFLEYNVNK